MPTYRLTKNWIVGLNLSFKFLLITNFAVGFTILRKYSEILELSNSYTRLKLLKKWN